MGIFLFLSLVCERCSFPLTYFLFSVFVIFFTPSRTIVIVFLLLPLFWPQSRFGWDGGMDGGPGLLPHVVSVGPTTPDQLALLLLRGPDWQVHGATSEA